MADTQASPATGLYDLGFYAWANQQAALLRQGRLSEADICNIAEEMDPEFWLGAA